MDSVDAAWIAENLSERHIGTRAEAHTLDAILDYFLAGYLGLIGIAVLARGVRALHERRGGMFRKFALGLVAAVSLSAAALAPTAASAKPFGGGFGGGWHEI